MPSDTPPPDSAPDGEYLAPDGERRATDGENSAPRVTGPASYFPSIERTYGRSIAEWKALIRGSDLTRHMELVGWLKSEFGMGHGHANALVGHTLAEDADSSDS